MPGNSLAGSFFTTFGVDICRRFNMTSAMTVRRMRLRPPRAPPMIAPTGMLLDGCSVLTEAIPVLDVAAGSRAVVDDMVAGVEVNTLGFVANDEEDTVTVLSRVDMLTAARDKEDIVVGEGDVIVGTASQIAEPGAFAHVMCV